MQKAFEGKTKNFIKHLTQKPLRRTEPRVESIGWMAKWEQRGGSVVNIQTK